MTMTLSASKCLHLVFKQIVFLTTLIVYTSIFSTIAYLPAAWAESNTSNDQTTSQIKNETATTTAKNTDTNTENAKQNKPESNPEKNTENDPDAIPKPPTTEDTLTTLKSFVDIQERLRGDIKTLSKSFKSAESTTEKEDLKAQIEKAEKELQETTSNLEKIAADTDISLLKPPEEQPFNLQKELFSLLEPALKEMKYLTSDVRVKADLREQIASYNERLPVVRKAIENVTILQKASQDKQLDNSLNILNENWTNQRTLLESKLQAAKLQLAKLDSTKTSFSDTSKKFFKEFFERRGWTLIQALLVITGVLLVSRFSYKFLVRSIKGYQAEHRSFRLRLTDLTHRIITVMSAIIGPMIVFYLAEDWVLFSLGILLLLGMGFTLRHAIPRYYEQIEIFLNIGSVREGERLLLDNIPWRVKRINRFTILDNPVAGVSQRVEIEDLVGMKSRPPVQGEPWFPCKKGDWVILNDGVRGKVISISIELVQMVQRGGNYCTYQMSDFLSNAPKNLSKNFRLKETIGIGYAHQKESTNVIPKLLKAYLEKRMEEEDYKKFLVNLNVEFQAANNSSLDLLVLADFKGESADIYNRLRRAIQRWCVDACTEYNWEIPYPQMTLHTAPSISLETPKAD